MTVCYREIKEIDYTVKLQKDIDSLGSWARKCRMRFQPVKCNMMQLTKKLTNKIQASFTEHEPSIKLFLTLLRVQYKYQIPRCDDYE